MSDWRSIPRHLLAAAERQLSPQMREHHHREIEIIVGIPCTKEDREAIESGRLWGRSKRDRIEIEAANKLIWC
jgi:hypothetical protein